MYNLLINPRLLLFFFIIIKRIVFLLILFQIRLLHFWGQYQLLSCINQLPQYKLAQILCQCKRKQNQQAKLHIIYQVRQWELKIILIIFFKFVSRLLQIFTMLHCIFLYNQKTTFLKKLISQIFLLVQIFHFYNADLKSILNYKTYYNNFIKMNRVRQKQNAKLQRSRSKSPNSSKVQINAISKSKPALKANVKSNQNLQKSRSKSPQRSQAKKNNGNLGKSKSQKKLNKSKSIKKVDSNKIGKSNSRVKVNNINTKNNQIKKSPRQIKNSSIVKEPAKIKNSPKNEPSKHNIKKSIQKQIQGNIKNEQKQIGIIFYKPEHDKIMFKSLQVTDEVFDKYHDMISNDNDSSYVINAMPQLISMKKEDDSTARDFVSGKITRLGGTFDNLNADKIANSVKKLPHYYNGQCGKNISAMKIVLQTKFKVEVDLGFLMYSIDGDKLTIFRIYVSKIYRKMNYLGYIYMQIFKMLMSKHSGADRWSIFVLERNIGIHKFFKYLGFKIEKIFTESYNKIVDYFQQFTIKKKQLNTVVSSMK